MQFSIRLLAECADDDAAGGIERRLLNALSRYQPATHTGPRRYWKAPELYEFQFDLTPATADSFVSLMATTEGGWSRGSAGEERWVVWNRSPGHAFLTPEVHWAHLEINAA